MMSGNDYATYACCMRIVSNGFWCVEIMGFVLEMSKFIACNGNYVMSYRVR